MSPVITSRTRTLLLTGFGPFPGMPANVSADLVQQLAESVRARHLNLAVHTRVLPTEWQRGCDEARRALDHFKPDLVIHFGVSAAARGFVIESCGANLCCSLPDAAGLVPTLSVLNLQGSAEHAVTLPVADIVAALTAAAHPVVRSTDAGRYLCNAVLYQSLAHARAREVSSAMRIGFVHIPSVLGPKGPLTMAQALAGSLIIVAACLAT